MQTSLKLTEDMQYFCFDGAKIAFDVLFPSSGVQMKSLFVLVNGYQRDRLDFRAFRKRLQNIPELGIVTLALDNRYSGKTEVFTEAPLTLFQLAADVKALANHYCRLLGLHTYSLLGISMGGMVAQILASEYQVEKLFLVSTTAGGEGRTWPSSVTNPETLEFKNHFVDLDSTEKQMRRYFGEKFLRSSPLLFSTLCKNILKKNSEEGSTDSLRAKIQFDASVHFNGVALLPKILSETLILSGDEDHIIPLENAHFLNKHIKNSSLAVFNGVGHLLLIEEPENIVLKIAESFKV